MTTFLDELRDALADGEPDVFVIERDVPTGNAASPRLPARLVWKDPEGGKAQRYALDATSLDRPLDAAAVERFAAAAAALKLKRAFMLSGLPASEGAVFVAGARGVRLVFAHDHPRPGRGKRPHVAIYPVINAYELLDAKPARALTQRQWEKLHARIEEDQRRVVIRGASGKVLGSFQDLGQALPLDRKDAFLGKGFPAKESAKHAYAFEGATLVVPGFPEVAIQGVSFDYWIEVRPLEAKTRAEAFASLLLDRLVDD